MPIDSTPPSRFRERLSRLHPRRSARLRLTTAFTGLVIVVGIAIVSSVVFSMTFLTDYKITSSGDTSTKGTASLWRDAHATAEGTTADRTSAAETPSLIGNLDIVTVSGRDDILRVLLTTSLLVFAGVLVGGVVLSWIIAGRVLRPVAALTAAARSASHGRLDHRIALVGPPDEFKRLADTFDEMLGRLDDSFQAQRRFAANASHELKSPLATTQAMLDVAILDPESVDVEVLTDRLRETNSRNIETVEALLVLAEAQSGAVERSEVDVDELVREVLALTRSAAEGAGVVVLHKPGSLRVEGDPVLLRLLVGNLVGNAIRHNRRGGDVTVAIDERSLVVVNTGVQLTPAVVDRLSEPFYRAAGRVQGSHGLGLALVTAIAHSHSAGVILTARPLGGLDARVEFSSSHS